MRRIRCSYTIEAAYIVPLCTMIIMLLLTETLFYRDILTTEGVALKAVDEAARYVQHSAKPGEAAIDYSHLKRGVFAELRRTHYSEENVLTGYVEERLRNRLWISVCGAADVRISGDRISVSVRLHGRDELRYLFRYLPSGLFLREISVSTKVESLSETNRLVVAAWDSGTRIKGVSGLLEKIEAYLAGLSD